jgi:protein-S-isoprenylcysteine O-methyltransferase Ste14
MTLALLAWTLRGLGRNLTDTVVTRRAATLVTHGAYRWVRHPFYLCMALVIFGNALMAANWFMLAAGAVVLSFIAVRTKTEEEKLVARFGDDYRSYMRRTGRFVPRFVSR